MTEILERTTHEDKAAVPPGGPAVGEHAREQILAGLPVTERLLDLAGISTAVLEGGDGPPIVLLHGPGEHATKWLRVIPDLVRRHRVVVPDLPGHGKSVVTGGPIDSNRVISWLYALIEETCATPPILVGQILAGAIAARFAADHGDHISRLLLVDAFGLAPFQPTPDFGQALTEFLTEPTADRHDALWRKCAFDLDRMRANMGKSWQWLKAYNLDRALTPSLHADQQSLMEQFGFAAIPVEELERITVPTSLIWGRHDLATQISVAEAASARFGWPLHVIEAAADDPPMEQPEAFLEALNNATADPAGDTREAWNGIAEGYDTFVTASHMWLANEGLQRAGLRPGMRFLDVAAGSGALSIPAARHGARVLSTVLSPVMLRRLLARAHEESLDIETRVMNGHALELEEDSFDLAGSQFGVMLFPDMPRGIAEMARVVKPGGRVLMNVYGAPDKIEFFGFFVRAIQSVVPSFDGPPMDPLPLPFQLKDPDRLRQEFVNAGLNDVQVETITETLTFQSGQQLWNWLVNSNPIVEMVLAHLSLTEDQREVVREALEVQIRERAGANATAVLTNPINIGIGTK